MAHWQNNLRSRRLKRTLTEEQMKPTIEVCLCGRVQRKFNDKVVSNWLQPDTGMTKAMRAGTYNQKHGTCTTCQAMRANRLAPVKVK